MGIAINKGDIPQAGIYTMVSAELDNPHKARFPKMNPWAQFQKSVHTSFYAESQSEAKEKIRNLLPPRTAWGWEHYIVSVTPVKISEL